MEYSFDVRHSASFASGFGSGVLPSIAPSGHGFIYLQGRESFYSEVYETYHRDQTAPLVTAEDVLETCERLSIKPHHTNILSFTHSVPSELLTTYLRKCVFDDHSLEAWQTSDRRALLAKYESEVGHSFPQKVWLIEFGALETVS